VSRWFEIATPTHPASFFVIKTCYEKNDHAYGEDDTITGTKYTFLTVAIEKCYNIINAKSCSEPVVIKI
jgi:hypothetical protein